MIQFKNKNHINFKELNQIKFKNTHLKLEELKNQFCNNQSTPIAEVFSPSVGSH